MSNQHIYIDYETFSSVDLKVHGLRRYAASPDFEIMLCAIGRYVDSKKVVEVFDLTQGPLPANIKAELLDDRVIKHAWNAQFERVCTERTYGAKLSPDAWHCSMVHALYCGLPGSLDECGRVLNIENVKLAAAGKKLIKKFCSPKRPSKRDPRVRLSSADPDCLPEWEDFKVYNRYDVLAEMDIEERIMCFPMPQRELDLYRLDQEINERGIGVDLTFAAQADAMHEVYKAEKKAELQALSGLDKVGSVAQIKAWLREYDIAIPTKADPVSGKVVETLDKEAVKTLLTDPTLPPEVVGLLEGRQQLGKSSNAKYAAMLAAASEDSRIRGLFQFYGANRTGRWAGRLVQLHNLPQNHIEYLDSARDIVHDFDGDTTAMELCFGNTPSILSQLIRTAFVSPPDKIFAVADFSAIEARVTAWLSGEQWRLDVFNTHGKIYEASAARMFKIPIESITKGSTERGKGKVAELAFGFGGAVHAAINFGAEKMGMAREELGVLVSDWRESSPNIVRFWHDCYNCALRAVNEKSGIPVVLHHGIEFNYEANAWGQTWLTIKLPSGRKLFYFSPRKAPGIFRGEDLAYLSADNTKTYVETRTFGGKLCENIVQATARDLLAEKMIYLDAAGYALVLHVHDEVVAEVDEDQAEEELARLCNMMGEEIAWAKGLPLNADGYVTGYYKKD